MMAALNSSAAAGSLGVDCFQQLSRHESDFSMLNELFTNTLHDVSHRPTLSFSLKTLVAQAQLELSIQQGFLKRISELFI